MRKSGLAGTNGSLGLRERTQAVIAAGVRGDLEHAERVLASSNPAGVLHAEAAFRETVIRFAIGLAELEARADSAAATCELISLIQIFGDRLDGETDRLLRQWGERAIETLEALDNGQEEYLQALDAFCRRIGGVSAADAFSLYLQGEEADVDICNAGTELSDNAKRLLERIIATWRVLMGAKAP